MRQAQRVSYRGERNLQPVKDQQHQHQIGHAADQGGVPLRNDGQRPAARQFGTRPEQAEDNRQQHGAQRQLQRHQRAFENDFRIAVQHDFDPVVRGK